MIAAVSQKVRSWFASITSPSATHASGMLILLGILAAVTEASGKEPIRVHHPKVSSASQAAAGSAAGAGGAALEDEAEVKTLNNQEMLYYVAMGMLVSQGLIRLITFISSRREAAALAARKKDDDLLEREEGSKRNKGKSKKTGGLSLNALEDLDEEALRKRRQEHLAALGDNASLLGSDSEDEDYEESEEESESESEEEDDFNEDESETESDIERRRRVLATGDAEVEE
ncbi:hypothetical protein EDD11_000692 [Mortierella claussenii]|nr:hypothetical protein EDD11_000692 [Mortierella claussenii]